MCGTGSSLVLSLVCCSEVSVPASLLTLQGLSGRPHLLQRPEGNGEREGYAWAQEDGLRGDREEELGLGRPVGKSQG
jgi:hypothetical protein